MSGPNLSQYFTSTTDSFFEGIAQSPPQTAHPIAETNSSTAGELQQPPAVLLADNHPHIPDDVKDLWEPPVSGNETSTSIRPNPTATLPGVQLATDLLDPIRQAVGPLLGQVEAQQRNVLGADQVTQDERGIRKLIENGALRSAVNLTGRLLTIYGQGFGRSGQSPAKHSPHSLQLWFTRLALLTKLGMHELCHAEAQPFGQLNRPDVYFEISPDMYPNRRGSMAPFSLRLLLAELPMYHNGGGVCGAKLALDRLTEIYLVCRKIVEFYDKKRQPVEDGNQYQLAFEFWHGREIRVVHSLINCALQMRDFNMTDSLMGLLADGKPELSTSDKKAVFSAWGRVYLQCGDVFGAERKFSEARRIRDGVSASELRDIIDKGLIAVAQNDFQTAQSSFENALKLGPTNAMLLNNLGVCSLYSGRLKEAIVYFEQAIQQAGAQNVLNDGLLLNLSTLYELESSNDVAKKLALLRQINLLPADVNVNLEFCLKLQPVNKSF